MSNSVICDLSSISSSGEREFFTRVFSYFVFFLFLTWVSGIALSLDCPDGLFAGDVDGNCQVDLGDVLAVSEQWLEPAGCVGHLTDCGDLIGNDGVDLRDFSVVRAYWLEGIAVINEIHYDPDVKVELVEFVELYNPGTIDIDISGWYFSDGLSFEFGPGSTIPAGGCVVVAQNTGQVISKYGVSALLVDGPFTGKLSNDGEKITLRNQRGDEIDEVDYQLGFPWPTVGDPIAVDGDGYSIQLVNADLDNDLAGSWRGAPPTPGAMNRVVYAVNTPPHIRQVEHSPKQAASGEVVTVSCKVTDPDGVNYVNLEYQVVEPGNYIRYKYADGSQFWFHMSLSQNSANVMPNQPEIVFDEVMYHPLNPTADEYIELYNPSGGGSVTFEENVGAWRLRIGGNDYDFPASPSAVTMSNGQRLIVVGFNPWTETSRLDDFETTYNTGNLTPGNDPASWSADSPSPGGVPAP